MKPHTLAIAGLALGCADREPTQQSPIVDPSIAEAHSPRHLGISLAVVPAAIPDYGQLDAASASGTAGSVKLAVDASGAITRFPDDFVGSVAVFGYAWVDTETGRGVVAVIHPAIGRDSRQNPDGWHSHPVQLAAGTASSTFCLAGIGSSQGGISIKDDVLDLNIALGQADIQASALDVAAAFVVAGDSGCPELAPGIRLGVQVLDVEGL